MRGIYSIENDKIILHPDSIKLSPILAQLTNDELKYIIICYDYINSPLANRPLSDRKDYAIRVIFGGKDTHIEDKKIIQDAIEEYKSLIFSSKLATIDKLNTKINMLDNLLIREQSHEVLPDIDKSIGILQKRLDQFETELMRDDEKIKLKGDKKTSLIEQMKLNKELYKIRKEEDI